MTSVVTFPDAIKEEWVGEPSKECKDRYEAFYHGRKLKPDSEGWSTTIIKFVARNTMSLAQTASAFVFPGARGVAAAVAAKNEVPYKACEKAAKTVHDYHTKWHRKPIEHTRIEKVIDKLYQIRDCANAEDFLKHLQQVYTTVYFGSKTSSDLKKMLASQVPTTEKIDAIVQYLLQHPEKNVNIFEHNGKKFYQIVVCMTEQATITKGA